MSIRFAQMERTLGEIDRARAIYAHCSEICDHRVSTFICSLHLEHWFYWKDLIQPCININIFHIQVHGQFWETWKEFEIKHGNEDTVREMLRIKRSVQAAYNANVNIMSAQMLAVQNGAVDINGLILQQKI